MNEPASEMNYTVVHKKKIPIPELLLLSARGVHTPNSYDATSLSFSPTPSVSFLPFFNGGPGISPWKIKELNMLVV